MSMTDPIADMLTRIRNANSIGMTEVKMPRSKIKTGIADVLKREGYISDYQEFEEGHQGEIQVSLKYGLEGEKVIQTIRRISKPGCRVYRQVKELKPVLSGLGISILSTPEGILSDREARAKNVGGEVLCTVW